MFVFLHIKSHAWLKFYIKRINRYATLHKTYITCLAQIQMNERTSVLLMHNVMERRAALEESIYQMALLEKKTGKLAIE